MHTGLFILLWCLGWQDALEDAAAEADFANSYIDDGRFGIAPDRAAPLLRRIAAAAERLGGELNYSKCIAYTESGELPEDLRSLNVECLDSLTPAAERGLVMQGIPIGTPEFQAAWLAANLAKQKSVMNRLATYVPDKLCAAQLLAYCVVPRVTHILRALPPSTTASFIADFDAAAAACFTAIAAPDLALSGLPPVALARLGLKQRHGGFGISVQARGAAAAHIASWMGSRNLILALLPTLTPHLPEASALPDAPNPTPVSCPASIRLLHAAVASLPDAALNCLRGLPDPDGNSPSPAQQPDPTAAAPSPPPPAATAAAAAAPAATTQLQRRLSRPSHASAARAFSESLATTNPAEAAKFLSQQGWLGIAWFRSLNRPRTPEYIDSAAFQLAVALHLSLPIAAFPTQPCTCGFGLSASSGPLHIAGCNQFSKDERSETFGDAFDSIMYDVSASAWIEGARPRSGPHRRCAAYATIPATNSTGAPVLDAITGQQKLRDIIPDRVVGGLTDSAVGASGHYVVDYTLVSPECATYCQGSGKAATEPLFTAKKAHVRKEHIYLPHLQPGDSLLAVAVEVWGGIHPSVHEKLRSWARMMGEDAIAPAADAERAGRTETARVLRVMQIRLSLALLRSRLVYVQGACRKLRGTVSRSQSAAYSIAHPVTQAQILGSLGGR